MPAKNEDLHGSAPEQCETALLLIDVINDLEFPEAEQILETAIEMARNIDRLKQRAREAGVPIVYVNDNFGKWKSDWRRTVEHCLGEDVRGRPLVEILQPGDDDYFVLKPKHSGFFSTTRHPFALSRIEAPDHDGNRWELLCPLHCERCLHAGLPRRYPGGLCCFQHATGERRSACADAEVLKAETPLGSDVELRLSGEPESR